MNKEGDIENHVGHYFTKLAKSILEALDSMDPGKTLMDADKIKVTHTFCMILMDMRFKTL